jgi:signal transduction histidine kinase
MNSNGHTLDPRTYQDYSILIVDDTPVNLATIVEYLESYGFAIRTARSGENALRSVHYDPPHLIMLDILMPGIDGFETCRRLQADEYTRDIPVIFMTALTNAEDKVKAFEMGAVDYVTKPLQHEEVLARILLHLRQRNQTRDLQEQNRQLTYSNQVEKARLFEAVNQQHTQLRTLTNKLTEVQENERRQLARELHDEIGQALTAIHINLAAIQKELPAASFARIRARVTESTVLADQILEQIRELALDLRPPMLDDLGLGPTLRWYLKRYSTRLKIETELTLTGLDTRLAPDIETALYRVIQEALTNTAKHAGASKVYVQVTRNPSTIVVSIVDDGQGFDVAEVLARTGQPYGMGLLSMRERVTLLCGSFDLAAQPGRGTHLTFSIPL